jgi:hypothetical protein
MFLPIFIICVLIILVHDPIRLLLIPVYFVLYLVIGFLAVWLFIDIIAVIGRCCH